MSHSAHFETRENKSPVDILFVHGNLASKYWWYPTLDVLEKSFQSVAVPFEGKIMLGELRGCGRSPLSESGEITVDEIVNDFAQYVEEQQLRNVFVVGHSAGGLITALLLARRPDLFKAAILVDPVGPTGLKNVPADIGERYKMMESNPDMAAQVVSATAYQSNPNTEFFKSKIMPDVMSSLKASGVKLVNALIDVDYTLEIALIQQPVKVFYGLHDWVLDVENAKEYLQLVKNSIYVELPENGHCLNYENPERMAAEIVEFIKDHAQ